jgi:hypothetical protein
MTRFLNKSLSELMEVSHDSFGSSDGAVVRKSFVISLDEPQVVEIIDHEPGGLAQAFARGIAEEVQSLQPGPIAEMETSHRIEWLSTRGFGPQIVECRQAEEDRT